MAEFYKGFAYEFDVVSKLTIEGCIIDVEDTSTIAERRSLAQALIDASSMLAHRRRQTTVQMGYLEQGAGYWNSWRRSHPEIQPMLANADLAGRQLDGFDMSYANLTQANLRGANLQGVNFHQAILAKADLTGADLSRANLCRTDLYETIFANASLVDVNIQGVQLVRNDFKNAEVMNCSVYGLSAWDLRMDDTERRGGFVIRYRPGERDEEQSVTVSDLELASFTYFALNNRNLTRLFNAAATTWVLLLGRFSERKELLTALAEALKEKFIPVIFDFPEPNQRDMIETVLLLAGMSAFVVVDLTDSRSTPLELQAIIPNYTVPIVPIILQGQDPFSMFAALRKYDWVLPPLVYDSSENLVQGLQKAIIEPATAKAHSLIDWKARKLQTRSIHEYLG